MPPLLSVRNSKSRGGLGRTLCTVSTVSAESVGRALSHCSLFITDKRSVAVVRLVHQLEGRRHSLKNLAALCVVQPPTEPLRELVRGASAARLPGTPASARRPWPPALCWAAAAARCPWAGRGSAPAGSPLWCPPQRPPRRQPRRSHASSFCAVPVSHCAAWSPQFSMGECVGEGEVRRACRACLSLARSCATMSACRLLPTARLASSINPVIRSC